MSTLLVRLNMLVRLSGRGLLGLIVLSLALSGAGKFSRVTQEGQQCPTAKVQLVQVPIVNCCGKTIGYTQRAPKAGEKAFLQCFCKEKSKAANSHGGSVVSFFAVLPQPSIIAPALELPEPHVSDSTVLHQIEASNPPPYSPPRSA